MMSASTGQFPATARHASGTDLDRLCIATIRSLSIDAVQRANSGHPGLPLGMAPVAHVLFSRFLRFDPAESAWPDRDRFILSAGHGSMLLYAMLHLSGCGLTLEDLRSFRQWGSLTPGHPEHGLTAGGGDDHRSARPGIRQRSRHGARRAFSA
jgi:transketolase